MRGLFCLLYGSVLRPFLSCFALIGAFRLSVVPHKFDLLDDLMLVYISIDLADACPLLLVPVPVTLLCPALTADATSERFVCPMEAQVVFEAADAVEHSLASRSPAPPDLVHSARRWVLLVPH